MSWIRTFTGKKFDLYAPTPEMVCIEDIAHALANICRFGGHAKHFYSVAQHSVLVGEIIFGSGCTKKLIRSALLHDANEAYVGDLMRPLKYDRLDDGERKVPSALGEEFNRIAHNIQDAIVDAFDLCVLSEEDAQRISKADMMALVTEARVLVADDTATWDLVPDTLPLGNAEIRHVPPEQAEAEFLSGLGDVLDVTGAAPAGAASSSSTFGATASESSGPTRTTPCAGNVSRRSCRASRADTIGSRTGRLTVERKRGRLRTTGRELVPS